MLTDDPEEVQLELREIARERKEFRQAALLLWAFGFAFQATALAGLVAAARWVFSNSDPTTVAVITCTAFIGTVISLAVYKVERRVNRMEMHALTVQAEVLGAKEKIEAMKWNS